MGWGTVVGAAIGGGLGLAGSKASAKASKQVARENRAWQERMSNTAYQRAADDLEAAGLNRILAFGSPATTPGGSVANIPDYGSAITQGAATGSSARLQSAQTRQTNAQTGATDASAKQIAAQTDHIREQQQKTKAETDAIKQNIKIKQPAEDVGTTLGSSFDMLTSGNMGDFVGDLLSRGTYSAKSATSKAANNLSKILKSYAPKKKKPHPVQRKRGPYRGRRRKK